MTPDWREIGAAIGAATESDFSLREAEPVRGGSIHDAWRVRDGQRCFFVKTGMPEAAAMFAAEAEGLRALSAVAVLRTPTPVTQGATGEFAYLVMEALDLKPLDAASGAHLGTALARLHRHAGTQYGWASDNFIGATPQCNSFHRDWPYFFADRRLRPQLDLAGARGMDRGLVRRGHELAERIGSLFLEYRPPPSLLHGDLWGGNAARLAGGEPVVFDPACYHGDRETDLAMAELFGGFPGAFFAAYRAEWPLDKDFERRKPLYNLYHVLNHFNLFGAAYLRQAERMIDSLLASLRR